MKKVTMEDLIDYPLLHNLKGNKQGTGAVFTKTQMNREEDCYNSNLWLVNPHTSQIQQLTTDNQISDFVWEEEDQLLFSAVRNQEDQAEKEDEPKTVYYRLNVCQGEAKRAFSFPYEVFGIEKVSTSLYVLAVEVKLNQIDQTNWTKQQKAQWNQVIELTELPFYYNGMGYIDSTRTGLVLFDQEKNQSTPLTHPNFELSSFAVVQDKIIYSGQSWTQVRGNHAGLYCYDINKQTTTTLIEQKSYHLGQFVVDETQVIIQASKGIPYGNMESYDFYRYDLVTHELKLLCEFEYSVGRTINSDVAYGRGQVMKLVDNTVYFTANCGYYTELYRLNQHNQPEKVFDFNGSISGFEFCGQTLLFQGMVQNELTELYEKTSEGIKKWTACSEVFKDTQLAIVEYAGFTSYRGQHIDGWVLKPIHYDSTKRYPGILEIHGGPRTTFGDMFFHEMQLMAAQGYFVFFCNHHGSDGKGDEFADLRSRYGTIDYEEMMEFTDVICKRYPQLDETRLGVIGGSYGGYMVNWMIGHTQQFSAAVSLRSISNWISDYGTSSISYDDDLHGYDRPWESIHKLWEHSPLKYAKHCKTPTLFIHSLEDYICSVGQAMEMYTALKVQGIETKACLFKEENHELSRSGKPSNRIRRLQEIMTWFNQYLA